MTFLSDPWFHILLFTIFFIICFASSCRVAATKTGEEIRIWHVPLAAVLLAASIQLVIEAVLWFAEY